MRRGRVLRQLLIVSAAAILVWLLVRPAQPPVPQRVSAPATTAGNGRPPPAAASPAASLRSSADTAAFTHGAGSFNQRLRCTQARFFYKRVASPEVLALLCERRPLKVLQIEAPLARAGDPHAIALVGMLANGGRCDLLAPSPALGERRAKMLAIARDNGANPETLQRLDDLLGEQQQGPTAQELETCRQAAGVLGKVRPGVTQQVVDALGRSMRTLRGENELDVRIEYARKMRVSGDAEGAEDLAELLLQKDTPESQAEAMTLLREAATRSASAKTELARCLLKGCPTPAPDPTEARELLTEAAAEGDLLALMTLAGPADAGGADLDPGLAPAERYAWGQLLQRLHAEGCFGATDYSAWATFPSPPEHQPSSLLAMSPAEATAAQSRAAELLATQLDQTRALLGCD
jgi:hypothetical protein